MRGEYETYKSCSSCLYSGSRCCIACDGDRYYIQKQDSQNVDSLENLAHEPNELTRGRTIDSYIAISNGRTCDTCVKQDVCMYKNSTRQVANELYDLLDKKEIFVELVVNCKKWGRKTSETGNLRDIAP